MDPLSILQNRIEQLEAKLGVTANTPVGGQQGDSATANLVNTAQALNNATAGYEKIAEAMPMANELNNYTDPNYVEKMQESDMHMHEVAAGEPVLRHHCRCMHQCRQSAPVMESEPLQQAPQMHAEVNQMQAEAAQIKVQSEQVTQGIQELAETCGTAASEASQQLADIAQKVEQVEETTTFRRRRNGLD